MIHKPAAVVQNRNYRPNKITTTFDEKVITTIRRDANLKPSAANDNQNYVSPYSFKYFQNTANIDSSYSKSMIAHQETTYNRDTIEAHAQPNYFRFRTHDDQLQNVRSEPKVSRVEKEEITTDYVPNARFVSSLNTHPNTFSNLENVLEETILQRIPLDSATTKYNNLKPKSLKCNVREPVNNNYNNKKDTQLRSHGNNQFSYRPIGTESNQIVTPPQIHVLDDESAQQFTKKMVTPSYYNSKQNDMANNSGNKLQPKYSRPYDKTLAIQGPELKYVLDGQVNDQYVEQHAANNQQSGMQSTVKQVDLNSKAFSQPKLEKYVHNDRMTPNRYRINEWPTQNDMSDDQKPITKNQLFYQYTPKRYQNQEEPQFKANNQQVISQMGAKTDKKIDRQLVKESNIIHQNRKFSHTNEKEPQPVMYKQNIYGDNFSRHDPEDFNIYDNPINTESNKYDDYIIYPKYLKTRDNRNPQFELEHKKQSVGEKQYYSRKLTENNFDRIELKRRVADEISNSDLHIEADQKRYTTAASIHQPIAYYGE